MANSLTAPWVGLYNRLSAQRPVTGAGSGADLHLVRHPIPAGLCAVRPEPPGAGVSVEARCPYQAVLICCLAVAAFNRAVALFGPSAATAIIAFLPVVASILAIPVLGEIPLSAQWLAIIVIGIGVCLAAQRPPVRSVLPKRPI